MNFAQKQKSSDTSRAVQRMNNAQEDVQAKDGIDHPNAEVQRNRNAVQRSTQNEDDSIQTKLSIGSPNDKFEQEADKTAERVMSRPKPTPSASNITEEEVFGSRDESISKQDFLQTVLYTEKPAPNTFLSEQKNDVMQMSQFIKDNSVAGKADPRTSMPRDSFLQTVMHKDPKPKSVKKKEDEKAIQKMSDEPVQANGNARMAKIEEKLVASRSGGFLMSDALLMEMEMRFGGADFSSVKIHTDSDAIEMCRQLNARAFTNGNHIYFNAGQFNPSTAQGKLLLAHELTHTIHQGATSNKVQREEEDVQLQEMDNDVQLMEDENAVVQTKPEDHAHSEDGDGVASRMDQKFKDEGSEDADPDQEVPEIDPAEKAAEKAEMTDSGIAKPTEDRPAKELPKVEMAAEEGKKRQEEVPETKEEPKVEEAPLRADVTPVDERESNALIALQEAETLKMPKKLKKLKAPVIKTPTDKTNAKLPVNAGNDKAVKALHEIAKLFVVQAYDLKTEAYEDAKAGKKLMSLIQGGHAKIASAAIGASLMKEDNLSRDNINDGQQVALEKVEKDVVLVETEGPSILKDANDGKDESAPLTDDAREQKKKAEDQEPDDAESATESKKQTAETGEVAGGAESMDSAFGETSSKTQQFLDEAKEGAIKNEETKGKIELNKANSEMTKAELTRIEEHNAASLEEMQLHDPYPSKVARETDLRAASGDELYTAAVVMNDELIDLQSEYYRSMGALDGKKEAQEKLDKAEKEQMAIGGGGEKVLTPEEEMLLRMSEMPQVEMEAMMMGMEESEIGMLQTTLDGMETKPEGEEPDGVLGKADETTGRQKVDLMKLFEGTPEQQDPDPRQEKMGQIEERRSQRIGLVKNISDANYAFLTGQQKSMLAEKLALGNTVDAVTNMSLLDFGKAAINGLLNPIESLKGVVDGAGRIASGFVNLLSAEAWRKDPLGNLLQSSADIATGLTTIFMSITGLATTLTILSGIAIVLTWFALAVPLAPFLTFLTSVITTVGGWTIVTGIIALALNELTRIKNLHDASVSTNTDELLFETDQIQQNMTDEMMMVMAVVGAKGDVAGAKVLQKSILKAGGSKAFQAGKRDVFRQGMKQTGKNIGSFVKGGVVKGSKQLAKQGAVRLKEGFRNTLQRIKTGVKNAPDNLKTKFKEKWKAFKDDLAPKKKVEVIDTPHGKLRKAPEGGDLGSFKGEKVKAEMDFPDGHKAKNLESGKCAICSNCQKINDKFGDQLALKKNDQLSADLKKVEADLKAKPGDPDLIAKQKAMHDDLEMQLYKDNVPNGKLTDKQIQEALDANKKFNPDTKRFGDPGGKKVRLSDAETKALQKGGGKNATPQGGKALDDLKARKTQVEAKIKEIEADVKRRSDPTNMNADAVTFRAKKKASLEKRHPKQLFIDEVELRFEKKYGHLKDQIPDYNKKKLDFAEGEYKKVKNKHSESYDRGKVNEEKGTAFEDIRANDGDGSRLDVNEDKRPVQIPPDGREVNISPDIETPDSFIEMKSGKLSMSPDTLDQIGRYSALGTQTGKKIVYELLDGADNSVLEAFKKYGIDYIDYSRI